MIVTEDIRLRQKKGRVVMKRKSNKRAAGIWLCLLLLACFLCMPQGKQNVQAAESQNEEQKAQIEMGMNYLGTMKTYAPTEIGFVRNIHFWYTNLSEEKVQMTLKSSNENVIKLLGNTTYTMLPGIEYGSEMQEVKFMGVGTTELIFTAGDIVYKEKCCVLPNSVEMETIEQTAYDKITVKWKKQTGVSGYLVERADILSNGKPSEQYKEVAAVVGENKCSVQLAVKWDKPYAYRVWGFISDGEKKQINEYASAEPMQFTAHKLGTEIVSVKKTGGSSLQIKWKQAKNAAGYKVYRSDQENGKYKCIYTTKSKTKVSYTQKVGTGKPYFYRVSVLYPKQGESELSNARSQMIPKKTKASSKELSGMEPCFGYGSYTGYGDQWEEPYDTYYYTKENKLYAVCVQQDKKIFVYQIDAKKKVKKIKTISLKYDEWGGFYAAEDGNFYIAVGYDNPKHDKKKTVIKVLQYSSQWKLKKTAAIKGGASNGNGHVTYFGVERPFAFGACNMAWSDQTLYLHTTRIMFFDGHQSSISFKINTKTMKAEDANESYASHSFSQLVRFKDGSLYLADHGDGDPRGLMLNMIDYYGRKGAVQKDVMMFELYGGFGENFTGCRMTGMEIGHKNIMICGTSQPHKETVGGVTGWNKDYGQNVYVLLTDRQTGKITVKWLTKYNPKTSKVKFDSIRMVKLTDDRFAILYTEKQNKKENVFDHYMQDKKETLHYVVVDNNGKKIYTKTYKNIPWNDAGQPILWNGTLVWIESFYDEIDDFRDKKGTTKLYQIPALW